MRLVTTHSSKNPLLVALESIGVEVQYIAWHEACEIDAWKGVDAFYGNFFDEVKKPLELFRLKHRLISAEVPYVFWNRDAPWNTGMTLKSRVAMQWIKPVDVYLAHSMQNFELFCGEAYYFPNAAQPEYYESANMHSLRDESSYIYDVSFFGSIGSARDANAKARRAFLAEIETRLRRKLPMVRFKVIDTSGQPMQISDQLALIRDTKINLNIGSMCDLPRDPSWGLPERVFGVPAAGGLLITDSRRSLEETFCDSICPSFAHIDECEALILNMLGDFPKQRMVAESVHREVLKRHTYKNRAQKFVEIVTGYAG